MTNITLPQQFHIVAGLVAAADAAGRTSAYVSLKHVRRAWAICKVNQGNAAQVTFSLLQATAVAGTGSKAAAAVPVWTNQDTATSDALARGTDAATFQTSAAVKNKIVVFQIDPATLDVNNNFDCIAVSTSASNAANTTDVLFVMESHYAQASLPSVIVD